ncbi:reverse transcriptase domain-containing protein [Flavicella marina]|uniref:reverse transcriptase domain-containing protein n=1 Tax=Flavicella marina TaxID=1475951 RepID=UPI00186B3D95|nr:reverse transcriptase domain-containing protein [Flavicella marina]
MNINTGILFFVMKKFNYHKIKYKNTELEEFISKELNSHLIKNILKHKSSFYKSFTVLKKNGAKRRIDQPHYKLMDIQKKIANYLLVKRKKNSSSHGFEYYRSIVTNAEKHINKNIVLNLDFKEFFKNISKSQVLSVLRNSFDITNESAYLLTELVTFNNCLPQGAPSSPVISNYVCNNLDNDLKTYCKEYNIIYTRYADDLTFSFNFKKLPRQIVDEIISIIVKHGFKLNDQKFRYFHKNSRQLVTGIVVNDHVNIKREFYKKVRAILHNWKTKGYVVTKQKFDLEYPNKNFRKTLLGWVNYIGYVRGKDNPMYLTLSSSLELLLRTKYPKSEFKTDEKYCDKCKTGILIETKEGGVKNNFKKSNDASYFFECNNEECNFSENIDSKYFFLKSKAYLKNNNLEKVKELLEKSIELDSNNYKAYNNLGVISYNKKEYKVSVEHYSNSIKAYRERAKPYYCRGRAYANLQQFENAILDYLKYIQLSTRKDVLNSVYFHLGQAYFKTHKYEEALNYVNLHIERFEITKAVIALKTACLNNLNNLNKRFELKIYKDASKIYDVIEKNENIWFEYQTIDSDESVKVALVSLIPKGILFNKEINSLSVKGYNLINKKEETYLIDNIANLINVPKEI